VRGLSSTLKPPQPTEKPSRPGENHALCPAARDRLRAFLCAYWLRPENAFWMTLRSLALSAAPWRGPSIDVSCGDGVFSYLHAGGAFDPAFDVFTVAASLDRVTKDHADMFDCAGEEYAPLIVRRPRATIDVGTDVKPSMIKRAGALEFYARLVLHDNNQALPFPDAGFLTVYCNSAYWVGNVQSFLAELARILAPEGRVVLQVKLEDMRRYTLGPLRDRLGSAFLSILGRGRMECWPSLAPRGEWERRFQRAGLRVIHEQPFATRTHAHLWDVGLRPIAPMLVRLANAVTPQTRLAVKHDWVELFCELLDPITRVDFDLFAAPHEPAEIQYVLQRA